MITILQWNVRGLNDPGKRAFLKAKLREEKYDMVALVETKIHTMDDHIL